MSNDIILDKIGLNSSGLISRLYECILSFAEKKNSACCVEVSRFFSLQTLPGDEFMLKTISPTDVAEVVSTTWSTTVRFETSEKAGFCWLAAPFKTNGTGLIFKKCSLKIAEVMLLFSIL